MNLALLILFPLFGFLINGFLYLNSTRSRSTTAASTVSARTSGAIATAAMFGAFGVAVLQVFRLFQLPVEGRLFEQKCFEWFSIAGMNVDFTLRLDPLSAVFVLVITGVGALIHLYSIGYMSHDSAPAKYFAYLNLFCFMMLNLVLGSNMPHVFLGWEGVGLASYLLIGFWYQDPAKVNAGMKAFVMNRVGDLGFLIAMFVVYKFVGSLDFLQIDRASLTPAATTTIGLLVFFACTGKSAQIPLFTWLPDAMAGPTPVSALIHAATMVTSGVYLLARMQGVIADSSTTLAVIAAVGATTAFVSAIIACAQNDIKKILAYSTVSQLGFMFVACGVGAMSIGVFHVMTHAFFKALMFLGAGSVIHALHDEQNVFKMGGLKKKLPITFWTFVAGWAAILGLPPFSGFFSKDEILIQAFQSPHGSLPLLLVMLASAFLTAFYMTRLVVLVFMGSARAEVSRSEKVHESPAVMWIPLAVLAVASVIGGWFGLPVLVGSESPVAHHGASGTAIMVGSVILALIAAAIAYRRYSVTKTEEAVNLVAARGFGIDQAYGFVFGKGTERLARGMNRVLEQNLVQKVIKWSSAVIELSGNLMKVAQAGSTQAYLMMMVFALFVGLAWFLFGVGQYGSY
jgi:NADH-quinone oxidoreductase subunit L